MLEMRGIAKSFSGNAVLKNIDFDVRAGEIHALMGENGAGKSTLMKILAGVHARDAGEILVDGEAVDFSGYDEARLAGVCMIYQELSLLPQFSVAENIFMGRWNGGGAGGLIDWKDIRARAREALARVGLRDLNIDLLAGGLPMATRQLLEVAKALLYDPKIVVFDEPTSTLTGGEAERLFRLMDELKGQGKGIVFISHRLKEILGNADRVTVLKDGEKVVTGDSADFDENKLIFHMIGRELADIYPPKSTLAAPREIFRFDGGEDARGGRLEFAVREGEVLGVGGLAGQGQIPLLESIFGLGGGGVATVRGEKRRVASPREAMAAGIALIPEDRNGQAAFPVLDIARNIAAASMERHSRRGFVSRALELPAVRRVAEALKVKMVSLAQEAMYLSGGNIQKTVFARWLLAEPKVMVLLSPTSGIDVGTKRQIYGLIRELADRNVAVIMLTGDMMELIGVCDRVMVMHGGRIAGFLRGGDLTEENIMKASVGNDAGREAS